MRNPKRRTMVGILLSFAHLLLARRPLGFLMRKWLSIIPMTQCWHPCPLIFLRWHPKCCWIFQQRKSNVKDIPKLTADFSADSNETPDLKSMNQLIRSFEVFCQIVCALAPAPVQQPLQLAMAVYRVRLLGTVGMSTFACVQGYHMEFTARAIRIGLDDPGIWRTRWIDVEWKLVPIVKSQPSKPATASRNTLYRFLDAGPNTVQNTSTSEENPLGQIQ